VQPSVSLDLGRMDIASCAWKDEAGVAAFSRFTNKEYQKKIGIREAQETRRRWRAGKPGLEAALAALPSAKTPCPFEMQRHLAKLLLILDDLLALNGLRRVKILRSSKHFRRQRVMSEICKRVTSPGKDVVDPRPVMVAFGAGMFRSFSRGHAPGPVKGVRQALRERGIEVHDVNEDYTGQLCSSCHKKVKALYTQGGKDFGGKDVYGVWRFLTATCSRRTMKRDANATLSMLNVFTEEALRGARPVQYTVGYQQQQQPDLSAHVPNEGDGV
jgi:hypothetical protein